MGGEDEEVFTIKPSPLSQRRFSKPKAQKNDEIRHIPSKKEKKRLKKIRKAEKKAKKAEKAKKEKKTTASRKRASAAKAKKGSTKGKGKGGGKATKKRNLLEVEDISELGTFSDDNYLGLLNFFSKHIYIWLILRNLSPFLLFWAFLSLLQNPILPFLSNRT